MSNWCFKQELTLEMCNSDANIKNKVTTSHPIRFLNLAKMQSRDKSNLTFRKTLLYFSHNFLSNATPGRRELEKFNFQENIKFYEQFYFHTLLYKLNFCHIIEI